MVKIVNIFKAAGLWVGTIFLLYGNRSVASSAALSYQGRGALAVSRSEGVRGKSRIYADMSPSVGFGGDPESYLRSASGLQFSVGHSRSGGSSLSQSFSVGQQKGGGSITGD